MEKYRLKTSVTMPEMDSAITNAINTMVRQVEPAEHSFWPTVAETLLLSDIQSRAVRLWTLDFDTEWRSSRS